MFFPCSVAFFSIPLRRRSTCTIHCFRRTDRKAQHSSCIFSHYCHDVAGTCTKCFQLDKSTPWTRSTVKAEGSSSCLQAQGTATAQRPSPPPPLSAPCKHDVLGPSRRGPQGNLLHLLSEVRNGKSTNPTMSCTPRTASSR